jgi:type IV fimbrial biogenesis protein FimT
MPFVNINRYEAGFTLVELIITLTIAGILIALAAPAMQTFILDQRLTTQANDFIADLGLSRSEAIRRGSNVVICKQGGSVSSPSCSTSAAWGTGWVAFVDADSDSVLDSSESVLRVRQSLDGGNTLNAIPSSTNSIVFANTGLTTLSSGEIGMRFCDTRLGNNAVTVWVNFTGRARIDRTAVASCTS